MTRPALLRRQVAKTAAVLAGGATVFWLLGQGEPPPDAWVRDRLWGDELLAYEVWDGVARAVLVTWDNRVKYDLMVRGNWFWPNWPPRPQWQLMGLGYAITASDAPATVGYAPCVGVWGERCGRPIELFGQINDPAIVAMEVLAGGTWRRFAVAAPGYAIRLDGVTIPPTGYRWLDATGRVVHELDAHAPTKPGPPPASRGGHHRRQRRGRRNATPVPSARNQNEPRVETERSEA